MNRRFWLSLVLTGCSLASAQERTAPAPPTGPTGLTPLNQVEPGVKADTTKEKSGTTAPATTGETTEIINSDDYRPTFSERMGGLCDAICRPVNFNWFHDWAGANGEVLKGDIEDPYWFKAEMLFARFSNGNAPPLLTTSLPQESQGILGNDGTQVLFGGSINMLTHLGSKVTLGMWKEPSQALGFEGSYFFLGGLKTFVHYASRGDPLLAAPYFDVIAGHQSSLLIANEEMVNLNIPSSFGEAEVGWSSAFQGAEFNAIHNLTRGTRARVDWTWGYRYLQLEESLYTSFFLSAAPPQGQQFGTQTHYFDVFDTQNEFHGFNVGLRSQWWWDCWCFDVNGKLALGAARSTLRVYGQTQLAAPPQFQLVQRGYGVYALNSNVGDESHTRFSVAPEIELGVGYQCSDHLRLTLNYNILALTEVVRPGDQIDTRINPNILDGNSGNPALPVRFNNTTTFTMQTFSFGFEYRY